MASILELLHTEQAKSQGCSCAACCSTASTSERANLQRVLNTTNANNLSNTVGSFITDSMISNVNHKAIL